MTTEEDIKHLENQNRMLKETLNSVQVVLMEQGHNMKVQAIRLESLDKLVRQIIFPLVNEQNV